MPLSFSSNRPSHLDTPRSPRRGQPLLYLFMRLLRIVCFWVGKRSISQLNFCFIMFLWIFLGFQHLCVTTDSRFLTRVNVRQQQQPCVPRVASPTPWVVDGINYHGGHNNGQSNQYFELHTEENATGTPRAEQPP